MKIVINACFGGFCLSEQAIRLYAERKGLTLHPEAGKFGLVTYWTVSAERRPQPLPEPWHSNPIEARVAYNKAYSESMLYDRDIPRNDPDLVAVVESIGDAASGRCASLKVVEIPDGVEWVIEEYDGNETIAEAHRTWG